MTFFPLEKANRLVDGYRRTFKVRGRELLLVHTDGKTYLFETTCPHAGASLATGNIHRHCIRCPRHGITFSLENGYAQGSAASKDLDPITRYPLSWRDGDIGFSLDLLN